MISGHPDRRKAAPKKLTRSQAPWGSASRCGGLPGRRVHPCCAEVPGPNGQGQSREECLANLREALR